MNYEGKKGEFQVSNCKLGWPTMMTTQWPWSDHLDRRMGVWVTSSGGRGGRQQLSGGPSLLTSTPVSCRWGQRGRKIKEKVFFTVRHILFQMKHLEFVSCATFSFQVQSAILKLKEFPFMTLMMITQQMFISTGVFLKAFGHKMSPWFSTIVWVLCWKGWG